MKKTVLLTLLIFALSLLLGAYAAEEYGIGQPWTVDGQWTLTVDSIEETQDRNPYSEKNPAAVYIVTYTYSNLGYEDSMGIMDGLYLSLDNRIVDCDGMMGYSYPASYDYNAQEVPIGAKCKAQAAIGVDTAGLPIKLYVNTYDGNGNQQSAVFVLGGEAPAAPAPAQTVEENDEDFTAEETLTIADIIPASDVWGLSSDAFQSAFPSSYSSAQVGEAPALVKSNLSVEGYPMSAYYVFADGALSKITYILMDDADKSAVKACAAQLSEAMTTAVGAAGTEGKGVTEWNNGSIQIGTAKLKNYTGKDNLSACVIFKKPSAAEPAAEPTTAPVEAPATPSIASFDDFAMAFNSIANRVASANLVQKAHNVSTDNIYRNSAGGVNDVIQYMYNEVELLQFAMPAGTKDIVQIMCFYSPYGNVDYSADFFWLYGEACVAAGIIDDVTDVRNLINELDFMNHMNDGDKNELTKNGMQVGYFVTDGVGYCFYIETL